jgi:hypothetical protein
VLNETVIGGDVSSQSQGGVMQGFQMPGAADQTAELLPDAAASSAANTAAGSVSSAANMTPDSSVSATD